MFKKSGLILVGILIIVAMIFWVKFFSAEDSSPTAPLDQKPLVLPPLNAPKQLSISGLYVCLPSKNTSPQTMECALGLMADDNNYYALDTQKLSSFIIYPTGTRLHISGLFTPIEMISADTWRKYNIKGIISVEKVNEIE
ncbi:MAG: hypothetical protein WC725_03245 [Patescibacteria group bacterium]|jgi:hypothetical protein